MKTFRNLALIAAVAALLSAPAYASTVQLCAPITPAAGAAKRITNPNTSTSYTTDGRGCAKVAFGDVAYFQSQGYIVSPGVIFASALTAKGTAILPASAYIDSITVQETSGGAINGSGIIIGTTDGGTQVMPGLAVAASTIYSVPDTSMSKRTFSSTAPQTLYINPAGTWGTQGRVNVTIHYSYF